MSTSSRSERADRVLTAAASQTRSSAASFDLDAELAAMRGRSVAKTEGSTRRAGASRLVGRRRLLASAAGLVVVAALGVLIGWGIRGDGDEKVSTATTLEDTTTKTATTDVPNTVGVDSTATRFSGDDLLTGIFLDVEGGGIESVTLLWADEVPGVRDRLTSPGRVLVAGAGTGFDAVLLERGDAFCFLVPTVRSEVSRSTVTMSVDPDVVDREAEACPDAEFDLAFGVDVSEGIETISVGAQSVDVAPPAETIVEEIQKPTAGADPDGFDLVTLDRGVVTFRAAGGAVRASVEIGPPTPGFAPGLVAATGDTAFVVSGNRLIIIRPDADPQVETTAMFSNVGPVTDAGYWVASNLDDPTATDPGAGSVDWVFRRFDGSITPGPRLPLWTLPVGDAGGTLAVTDRESAPFIALTGTDAELDVVAVGGPLLVTDTDAYVRVEESIVRVDFATRTSTVVADLDGVVASTNGSAGISPDRRRLAVMMKNDVGYDEHRLAIVDLETGDVTLLAMPDGHAVAWIDDRRVLVSEGVAPIVVDVIDGAVGQLDLGDVQVVPVLVAPSRPDRVNRPLIDPELCAPVAATAGSIAPRRLISPLTLFARPSEEPISLQVIGSPDDGPAKPFAIVQRFVDREANGVPGDIEEIGGNAVALRVLPDGNGEAEWELPDGSVGYLRSRGLSRADLVAVIDALTPRPTVPGFDVAGDSIAPREVVVDALNTDDFVGSSTTSECRTTDDGIYRLVVPSGDLLSQYVAVIDRPTPLDVGVVGGRTIVLSGRDVPGAPALTDVIDADPDLWETLLERRVPFPPFEATPDDTAVVPLTSAEGTQTGFLTVRVAESEGVAFLEILTDGAELVDGADLWATEIDGRIRGQSSARVGGVLGVRIGDAPVDRPIEIVVSVVDIDGFVLQSTGTVELLAES